jgi:hypothetical protein
LDEELQLSVETMDLSGQLPAAVDEFAGKASNDTIERGQPGCDFG